MGAHVNGRSLVTPARPSHVVVVTASVYSQQSFSGKRISAINGVTRGDWTVFSNNIALLTFTFQFTAISVLFHKHICY